MTFLERDRLMKHNPPPLVQSRKFKMSQPCYRSHFCMTSKVNVGRVSAEGTTEYLFKELPKRWITSSICLLSCIACPGSQWKKKKNEEVRPWEETLDSVVICLCSGPHTWRIGIQDTLVNVRGLLGGGGRDSQKGRDKERKGLQSQIWRSGWFLKASSSPWFWYT